MVTRLSASAFAFAFAFAMTIAAPASAQPDKPPVEVVGERGSLDPSKLNELVGLELGAEGSRVTRIVIDVRGGRADVDVRVGDEHRKGSVAVAAIEPERALALFVGELARGATTPAATPPAPPATPAVTPPTPVEDRPPPSSPAATPASPWQFSALATMGARLVTTHGAWVATPKLEIGARHDGALRLGAIARYGYASSNDPLGTARAHALAGGIAATYVLATGATFAFATGPRLEIGLVAGRGDGTNGTSTTALTLAGSWELELHVKLGGGVTLLTAVEGGTFFRGIELHADDRDVLHLSGPFAGLALGAML